MFILLLSFFASDGVNAASERRVRDAMIEHEPNHQIIWKLLEIFSLKADGPPLLRIYSDRSSFVATVESGEVKIEVLLVGLEFYESLTGKAKPAQADDVKAEPKAERFAMEFQDRELADLLVYLIGHVDTLDTSDIGLDGGFAFFDARKENGTTTTFEVWGPPPGKAPITAELLDLIWTFTYLLRLSDASEEKWKDYDAWNFTRCFMEVSSMGLTREKAKEHLKRAFKSRILQLVAAMKQREREARGEK